MAELPAQEETQEQVQKLKLPQAKFPFLKQEKTSKTLLTNSRFIIN